MLKVGSKERVKAVRAYMKQPTDGLLYDFDLLPEQIKKGSMKYLLMECIIEFKKCYDKKKAKRSAKCL